MTQQPLKLEKNRFGILRASKKHLMLGFAKFENDQILYNESSHRYLKKTKLILG